MLYVFVLGSFILVTVGVELAYLFGVGFGFFGFDAIQVFGFALVCLRFLVSC